ncbi:MAG: hypothetical protein JHD16_09915 [Solirubrobacteraceae bacterium]|nr:hypothetical protein [Solirubrobacteraceae bacterium]
MTDGHPHPSVDDLLDAFIAAWHGGQAPRLDAFVDRAAEADREELTQLIAAFLQLAPTVEPTAERGIELVQDPLVHRLAGLEDAWWDAQAAGEEERAEDVLVAGEALAAVEAPWGERLRQLRESAGLDLAALAARFADRFGLSAGEAGKAPQALGRLEDGTLAPTGVAARAARVLEELLAAPAGALTAGAAPALGGALLRGALPEDADERERFADLLREVDDALPAADGQPAGETLHGLLGA